MEGLWYTLYYGLVCHGNGNNMSERQFDHTYVTECWLGTSRGCSVHIYLTVRPCFFILLVSCCLHVTGGQQQCSIKALSFDERQNYSHHSFFLAYYPPNLLCHILQQVSIPSLCPGQDKRGCCHRNLRVLTRGKVVHKNNWVHKNHLSWSVLVSL